MHSQQVHRQEAKPHKCQTCNKGFANSSYLSQHQRIHAGLKPHKCIACGRAFTQLCHLQQHIRTHTGEKPYRCRHPGCEKAFSQLSNLQSHMRTHMTDRPFKCNSCYKCFADESALRDHIPKHSATKHLKTHICKLCGKSYTQETYLAGHLLKHDKGVLRERSDRKNKGLVISVPTISSTQDVCVKQEISSLSPSELDFSSVDTMPSPHASLPIADNKSSFSLQPATPSAFFPLMTSSTSLPTNSDIMSNSMLSRYNPTFPVLGNTSSCLLTSPSCHIPQSLSLNVYDLVKREHVPDYHQMTNHCSTQHDSSNLFKFDHIQNFSPINPTFSFNHFDGSFNGGDLLRKRGDLC